VRDDPFDLDNLRLTPEAAAAMGRAAAAKEARAQPKRQRQQFVMVPWWWVERLKAARLAATYRVALYLLFQHWKTGKPVPASNAALKALGVPRRSKYRAIRELERLDLIRVERRRRRSPVVTVCTKT
jgi:CRP-like cAMP-binding protein